MMNRQNQQYHFGNAMVTLFNVGHSRFDLADSLDADSAEWSLRYAASFAQPAIVPIQCIHIALPTTTILVDAGRYDFAPDSPFAMPDDYTPPPHLLEQMQSANLTPDTVEHLIITHLHGDHFNALTVEKDGQFVPAFPNAQCYIGRADWERSMTQAALTDPLSLESQTLGVLQQRNSLTLVAGEFTVVPGVKILPTPGETPAHQIVRIDTERQVVYCLGDLYHHPVEVEQAGWSVKWADGEANKASRNWFRDVARQEKAQLIATHIEGMGQLEETADGVIWAGV